MKTQQLTPSRATWLQYWQLTRPITLLPPAISFLAASFCAMVNYQMFSPDLLLKAFIGAIMATFLNAASNSLNQITDLEIDRANGSGRPLVNGSISFDGVITFTAFGYMITLLLASWVSRECMAIVTLGAFNTVIYSLGPRTKKHWFWANFTIAITRGLLLFLAGWSAIATAFDPQPIFLGLVLTLFLLGAASTKDFSDIEGDRADNCITLPVKFGYRNATYIIWPFLCLPFLLLLIGSHTLLNVNSIILDGLSVYLFFWGLFLGRFILNNPTVIRANKHASWLQMYLMFMVTQVGIALAYWLT